MLMLAGFLVAPRQPVQKAEGLYSVPTKTGIWRFENPGTQSQRTILAISNLDLNQSRVLRLQECGADTCGLRELTFLSPEGQSERVVPAPIDSGLPCPAREPAPLRNFTVHCGDGPFDDVRFFEPLSTRLLGFSRSASVYLHPAAREPPSAAIQALLSVFEKQHKAVASIFGRRTRDIDGDGRFCILLVPKPPPDMPVAFVRPDDFCDAANQELSNGSDMMYLSAELPREAFLESVLAHEYAHAICCSARPGVLEDDWLHEAIAHSAEQFVAESRENIDHRISQFFNQPHRHPLVVADYFAAGLYRDHGCRGATATFLKTVCEHHGGAGLFAKLLQTSSVGTHNLEAATRTRFPGLIREWTASLLSGPLSKPQVVGDFVTLGPRPIQWDGTSRFEMTIASTATAFIELPVQARAYEIRTDGPVPPQATLLTSTRQPPLRIEATTASGDARARIGIPSNRPARRLVVGFEATTRGRTRSLGVREIRNPRGVIVIDRPRCAKSVRVKAFAEYPDGTFSVGRTILPPNRVQLTKLRVGRSNVN